MVTKQLDSTQEGWDAPPRSWWRFGWLVVPVLVGVAIRGFHLVAVSQAAPLGELLLLDSKMYWDDAHALLGGNFGTEPYRTGPLYPLVLASLWSVFGVSLPAVFAVQTMVGLGSIVLVTLLARRVASAQAACAAGTAFAAYGPTIMLEAKLMSETLAVALVLFGTYLLTGVSLSRRRCVASGVVLGAACLLRPDFLLALPLVALARFGNLSWRLSAVLGPDLKMRKQAAFCAIGAASVISLATARNLAVSGEFVLISSQGGITFYHGNNARSEGTFAPPPELPAGKQAHDAQARAFAEHELGRHLSTAELNAFWARRGFAHLLSDPVAALVLVGRKLAYFASSTELSGEYVLKAEQCLVPSLRVAVTPFGLFLSGAVLGVPLAWRRRRRLTAVIVAVTAAALVTALVFFASSRYRLIAAALLAVLIAPALDEIRSKSWAGSNPVRLRIGAALVVLAVSLAPFGDVERVQAAGEFYNLGGELYVRGQFQEAIRYYRTALPVRPRFFDLRFNLAHAYAVGGDYSAAAEQMRAASSLDPSAADAAHYVNEYASKARPGAPHEAPSAPVCEL
jgi:tetratricopeptide (TPR) repeat protein